MSTSPLLQHNVQHFLLLGKNTASVCAWWRHQKLRTFLSIQRIFFKFGGNLLYICGSPQVTVLIFCMFQLLTQAAKNFASLETTIQNSADVSPVVFLAPALKGMVLGSVTSVCPYVRHTFRLSGLSWQGGVSRPNLRSLASRWRSHIEVKCQLFEQFFLSGP
jgi:hypothetical protein